MGKYYSFILILSIFALSHTSSISASQYHNVDAWSYKGVAITGYWHSSFNNPYVKKEIDYLKKLGVNAIELVPTWYQDSLSSNKIYCHPKKTIKDKDLIRVIKYIKKQGLKVNLKPHVDPFPEFMQKIDQHDFDDILNRLNQLKKEKDYNCIYKAYMPSQVPGIYELKEKINDIDKKRCLEIIFENFPNMLWRASINPSNPAKWFKSWRCFINRYYKIAMENEVDIFTVGTELVSMTRPKYLSYWQNIINDLRSKQAQTKEYLPKLIYAANDFEIFGVPNKSHPYELEIGDRWVNRDSLTIYSITDKRISSVEKEAVRKFWDLFDYISMTVYFELGDYDTKDVEHLKGLPKDIDGNPSTIKDRWRVKISQLEDWRKELGLPHKKMIFNELGYRSVDYGHYKPYRPDIKIFDEPIPMVSENSYNPENQKRCYETVFNALNQIDWLDGVFFWEEQIKDPPIYINVKNTTYSIIGKPASAIIKSVFTKSENNDAKVTGITPVNFYFNRNIFDVMTGGSYFESYHADDKDQNTGWYVWEKLRARPLSIDLGEMLFKKIEFGGFAYNANGHGNQKLNDGSFDWRSPVGGFTTKLTGQYYSLDLDYGRGKKYSKSKSCEGLYKSNQEDKLEYVSAYLDIRYLQEIGMKWFSKTGINFELSKKLNTDFSSTWEGNPADSVSYDIDRKELCVQQGIYDFSPFGYRLTLGAQYSYGREYGEKAPEFYKIGPFITFGLNGDDIASIAVLYKEQIGGDALWSGVFFVDIWKIMMAYGHKM